MENWLYLLDLPPIKHTMSLVTRRDFHFQSSLLYFSSNVWQFDQQITCEYKIFSHVCTFVSLSISLFLTAVEAQGNGFIDVEKPLLVHLTT